MFHGGWLNKDEQSLLVAVFQSLCGHEGKYLFKKKKAIFKENRYLQLICCAQITFLKKDYMLNGFLVNKHIWTQGTLK